MRLVPIKPNCEPDGEIWSRGHLSCANAAFSCNPDFPKSGAWMGKAFTSCFCTRDVH